MKLKLELENSQTYIDEPKEIKAVCVGEEKYLETLYKIADKYHLMTEQELQTINKIANEKSARTEI